MQNQPNWKLPLALAAILFVLGAAAYWQEYTHKPHEEEAAANAKKIFLLKGKEVADFKLIADGKTFEFKCQTLSQKLCKPGDNSKWEIVEPEKLSADNASVIGFLSSLDNLTPMDTIDLKGETPQKRAELLGEYKVNEKSRQDGTAVQVIANLEDGSAQDLIVGAKHPVSAGSFAVRADQPKGAALKVDDEKAYVLADYFTTNLHKGLTYWRDKKLFTLGSTEVGSFELKGSHGLIKADRKDGQWILESGQDKDVPGDIENIDSLVTSITYLAATDFVSEKKSDAEARKVLKGTKEALRVQLVPNASSTTKTPVTMVLYVKGKGASAPVYAIVSDRDPIFQLDAGTVGRLDKSLKDLRLQKLITSLDRFTIKKIQVSGKPMGSQPLVLEQKNSNWVIGNQTAQNERVQTLLDRLSGKRINDFLSGKAIPKGQEGGITLTLFGENGQPKRKITFWKDSGKLYAKDLMSKRPEAFLVDSFLMDALPWERDFFTQSPAPKKK